LIAYFARSDNTVVVNPIDVDAVSSASLSPPGNIATMAQWIQQETGGDLFPIVVEQPYSENYDDCLERAGEEIRNNARPPLSTTVDNIEQYDVIFIGYPIWWSNAPAPVFTFLEDYDFSEKTVILFASHGTSRLGSSVADITAMLPNTTVLEPFGVYLQDAMNAKDALLAWLEELKYQPVS
jgi:flavodoxin